MRSFLNNSPGPVFYSLALHAALVLAFMLDVDFWQTRPAAAGRPESIRATVVDAAVLEESRPEPVPEPQQPAPEPEPEPEQQPEPAPEPEQQPEPEPEQPEPESESEQQPEPVPESDETEREEAAELERQRQEEAAAREAERERQAELERQREAEAERQAELERQRREEEERRRREEAERQRREAEARRQAELEAELQRQLEAEAQARQARESGLLDEYRRDIQNVIRQNWIRPDSAQSGIECVVNVRQIPSGEVISVSIGRCNGDDAVVRSIERAVLRASPLPTPPVPELFERNLDIIFSPDD